MPAFGVLQRHDSTLVGFGAGISVADRMTRRPLFSSSLSICSVAAPEVPSALSPARSQGFVQSVGPTDRRAFSLPDILRSAWPLLAGSCQASQRGCAWLSPLFSLGYFSSWEPLFFAVCLGNSWWPGVKVDALGCDLTRSYL